MYSEANADKVKLNLGETDKPFKIKWFDPRNGGALKDGSITSVKANGIVQLGVPPNAREKDWVILLQVL